jgi:hypothetical protein
MKHIFYTIALFAASLTTMRAQTIVEADLPNVGDIVVEYIDTTNFWNYSIGNSGTNQTWNFTQFAINDTGGIYCLAPSSIPWNVPALLPNGEFGVYDIQDTAAAMYASNNTGLYLVGWYNGSATAPFNLYAPVNGRLMMPVPFSMNSTRTHHSTFTISGVYTDPNTNIPINVQNKTTYIQNFTADGQGTVITPTGTYNCIRVKEFSYQIDSIYADITNTGNYVFTAVDGPKDTTLAYRWASNGLPCYRFQIELDPQTNQVKRASFFDNDLVFTSLHNTNQSFEGLIYPNPINSGNTFQIQNSEGYNQLLVYDMHGNLVKQESLMSNSLNTIAIDELSNGIYLLKMTGNKSSINQKLLLNR